MVKMLISSKEDIFSEESAAKRFLSIKDSTITLFFPLVITLNNPGRPAMEIIPSNVIQLNFSQKYKIFMILSD